LELIDRALGPALFERTADLDDEAAMGSKNPMHLLCKLHEPVVVPFLVLVSILLLVLEGKGRRSNDKVDTAIWELFQGLSTITLKQPTSLRGISGF